MKMASFCRGFFISIPKIQCARTLLGTRSVKRWVAPTLKALKRRKDRLGPDPVTPRSNFLEWNYNAEVYAFGKRLNETFDSKLLHKAFTHSSYIVQEKMRQEKVGIENPEVNIEDNKALAELGEKIAEEYIEKFLKKNLPNFPDDGRKAVKDFLMSDDVLANISTHLGTKDIILCSDFPVEKYTLSSTLKAVIGALSQSSGQHRACEFVRDFIVTQLNNLDVNELWEIHHPIELLKDIYEKCGRGELEPRLISEAGRNTILAVYQVGIYCDKKLVGIGSGESVSIAQEMAARDALKSHFGTNDNMAPFNFNVQVSDDTYIKIAAS